MEDTEAITKACSLYLTAEKALVEEHSEEAWNAATEALDIFREAGDDKSVAECLRILIGVLQLKEDADAAEERASLELELFQELSCVWGEAAMLLSLTEINADRAGSKQFAETQREVALQTGMEALALFREVEDQKMEGCCQLALSTVYRQNDALKEAKTCAAAAVSTFHTLEEKFLEAKALHSLSLVLGKSGKVWDAAKSSKKAYSILEQMDVPRSQAHEIMTIAKWMKMDEDWEKVLAAAEEAMLIFKEEGMGKCEVSALDLVVEAYTELKRTDEGLELAANVLEAVRSAGSLKEEASVLGIISNAHLAKHEATESLKLSEQQLTAVRQLGDSSWEASCLHSLAELHLSMEQFEMAWKRSWDAMQLYKTVENKDMEAEVKLQIMVPLYTSRGDYEEALRVAKESLRYFQGSGDETNEAMGLLVLGSVHHTMGSEHEEETLRLFLKAHDLYQANSDTWNEAKVCKMIADFHLSYKRPEEAARFGHDSRVLFNRARDRKEEVIMFVFVSQCHLAVLRQTVASAKEEEEEEVRESISFQAEWEKALKAAGSAKMLARKIGDSELLAEALYVTGDVLIIQGEDKDAMEAADEALELFTEAELTVGIAHAQVLRAQVFDFRKEKDKALEAAKEGLAKAKEADDARAAEQAQSVIARLQSGAKMDTGPAVQEVAAEAAIKGASSAGPGAEEEGMKGLDAEVVAAGMQDVLAQLLNDEVEQDVPFMDAGVDSLLSIQFRQELTNRFKGLNMSSTVVFDYPNARQLTDHIVEMSIEAAGG
mmetsp:Transcript_117227/g.202560  ORF Transcript_117227/g.202560 Transcript_117227/m.202560 type:complete len:774 (+) Transcript_117227:62-2383(+)